MIYCVEDDAGIRDIEVYTLRSVGFEAQGVPDGNALFKALEQCVPELILLDVMLPGMDGVAILKRLKSNVATKDIPVIMATAKGAEYSKIESLDIGADDYLVKPFGMMEMAARIRAVLRRSGQGDQNSLQTGFIKMDVAAHTVIADGEPVVLTLKEFELLRLFMSRPGMVFTRDRLLSDVWGIEYDGETRTVDVHIRSLRTKLGQSGELIETVRGVGYRLEAK